MTTFNLRFRTDSDAFFPEGGGDLQTEVIAVLGRAVKQITRDGLDNGPGPVEGTLLDTNGNSVGKWSLTEDPILTAETDDNDVLWVKADGVPIMAAEPVDPAAVPVGSASAIDVAVYDGSGDLTTVFIGTVYVPEGD